MQFVLFLFATGVSVLMQSALSASEPKSRRPVAVSLSDDAKRLFTANRDSGTASVLDTRTLSVIDEIELGGQPCDIVWLPDNQLLVLDEKNHLLLLLREKESHWRIASRTRVAQFPIRAAVERNSKRCFVSSLWSRTISMLQLPTDDGETEPKILKTLRLPFEPRELCLTLDGVYLICANAFEAGLAVISTDDLKLVALKKIPGHNIRGLAITPDSKQLLVAQQELNPLAHSTRDDVHWGNMISNLLVSFPIDQVCDSSTDRLKHRSANQLGEPGAAASDPGSISMGPDGEITVLLSGVHELAIADGEFEISKRIPVGQRPVSAVSSRDGRVFVANMFSDSISVVNVRDTKEVDLISLGPHPKPNIVQRGEKLFFDASISLDGWMSCHSCHTDGHSNGQLNDNLSDGSFGASKRVLSLLGVSDSAPWSWTGEVESLEQQVVNSIEKTMRGATPKDEQVAALVAFMKTLSVPRVLSDNQSTKTSIERGRKLFESFGCAECHAPPTFTTPKSYDVGLKDSVGNDSFNPPSLRGVAHRRSFFHDGRAKSLTEIFAKHKHQLSEDLPDSDIKSLVDFLKAVGHDDPP